MYVREPCSHTPRLEGLSSPLLTVGGEEASHGVECVVGEILYCVKISPVSPKDIEISLLHFASAQSARTRPLHALAPPSLPPLIRTDSQHGKGDAQQQAARLAAICSSFGRGRAAEPPLRNSIDCEKVSSTTKLGPAIRFVDFRM